MSTVDRPEVRALPPLVAGQRLDQPTFHRRYAAMAEETWAELAGGVVYTPSPLRAEHGDMDHLVSFWLMTYRRATPQLGSGANVTTKLGPTGELQPDAHLRILEQAGGQARTVDGYVTGPPELVVEIARSSRAYDLGQKKEEYQRSGVVEYLFVGLDPEEVHWFHRGDGGFVEVTPGPDGIFRSEVFTGLWLDPTSLFAGNLDGLIAALERGLATPEHAGFVDRLRAHAAGD